MESNNWRSPQAEPVVDAGDWRSQLQSDSRKRIVNKIMETLKRHLPFSGQEGLHELRKIAMRFEEKIYTEATSQSDYLRKISLKMLTMESKSQNNVPNAIASNSTGIGKNQQDSVASQNSQPQVHNQTQSLSILMPPSQSQIQEQARQLLAQNIQNNIASAGMQSSVGLAPTLSPASGLPQNSIPNVNQTSNLQNISGISQNSMGNSLGSGVPSNMLANAAQRQMQGRQHAQQVGPQQQVQNSQQFYQQQLQQQIHQKQKLQQGNIQQPLVQPHIQHQQPQQNLLHQAQLQSSQQSVMQTSSVMQASMITGMQQNQQSSMQQPSQSVFQQHQQSMIRQQQPQLTSSILQPRMQMPQQPMLSSQPQQPMLSSQPQQQVVGQQSSAADMQQNQLNGQQNGIPDMQQQPHQQRLLGQPNSLPNLSSQQQNNHQNLQQQQLTGQHNNLSSIRQQQLGPQSHVGGLPQQQQLLGTQAGNSSMQANQHPIHIMQQSKIPVQQQTQNASALLPGGGQQPQSLPQPQQQLMSQIQSQPSQLQQQLGLQQQPNSLQHNTQRLQPSSALLQQQNMIDQQKQIFSEAPSTSLDSTAQTGTTVDWQEEVYQKIKAMKELYYADLNEMYQKISFKLQQHDSVPQQPQTQPLEKLRIFKHMLEKLMQFLQLGKSNISPAQKEKLASYEKQITTFLNSNRPRKPAILLQQGQLPPPHMQSMQQTPQPHAQIPQTQSQDSGMNPQFQSLNLQNSVPTMQHSNLASLQHCSAPSLSEVGSSQPNMINTLQSGSNLDSGLGNATSPTQPAAMGSLQQNPVTVPQQANTSSLPLQNGANLLHTNIKSLQSNSNFLQNQYLKQQEQQIMQSQQMKQQLQQRQIQQQLLQKQQIVQQQQLHQQTKQLHQQQPGQMQAHPMPQLHQISEVNELKMRQGMTLKQGVLPQHLSQGQRYLHQQVKSGTSFAVSSPQLLQAASPPINRHLSPQIDQHNVLPSLTKVGTPLQSANSPILVPSPSTSLAPSPVPGEPEKPNSGLASLSNAANNSHQQITVVPASGPSLSIGTPGISASPLLAEFSGLDGNHGNALIISGKSGSTEQPLERLLKAVKSVSSKALNASVSDIGSVVSMIDRIAGSAPGNGSRAAVGEDLVAMTKCRTQARNFTTQDGSTGTKRIKRYTSAMPLNVASSVGSMNDSFKKLIGCDTSELESTATSDVKRNEANHALLEEIREINERLIDTVVCISDEEVDPTTATAEGKEGTIVKCSFTAVAVSPDLKSQYASDQMSPIEPLKLLVPANYPNCSPILLDKFPVEASKEYEDLSVKAKSRFSISLRTLSQPLSLRVIAWTWDGCTRAVISEYAQQNGGGTFSSKYGTWDNCLSAA